jgi:hypothetical protein
MAKSTQAQISSWPFLGLERVCARNYIWQRSTSLSFSTPKSVFYLPATQRIVGEGQRCVAGGAWSKLPWGKWVSGEEGVIHYLILVLLQARLIPSKLGWRGEIPAVLDQLPSFHQFMILCPFLQDPLICPISKKSQQKQNWDKGSLEALQGKIAYFVRCIDRW